MPSPLATPADARRDGPLPHETAAILHLARENLRLLAALARRYEVGALDADPDGRVLRHPSDVANYLGPEMAALAQEQLRTVLLDCKNRILGVELIYQGGLNAVNIRLADCFREAVRAGAAAILLVHNHPSGDPAPSPSDVKFTREARWAGELLDIPVLDHVILGRPGFVSLRQQGLYPSAAGRDDLIAADA